MCERNIDWLPLARTCNPGTCPDQESNWQPFVLRDNTQLTEPHQSGLYEVHFKFLKYGWVRCDIFFFFVLCSPKLYRRCKDVYRKTYNTVKQTKIKNKNEG